jgi:hypothetical protein
MRHEAAQRDPLDGRGLKSSRPPDHYARLRVRTAPRRLVLAVFLATVVAAPGRARGQQVNVRLVNALNRVQNLLGETFGRSVPLPSASAGVSYSFDPVTGNFQRNATTFGQLYLDRAEPIGARRFNFSFAYQWVKLKEIDGQDSDKLDDPVPIPFRGKALAIELPHVSIDAAVHEFLFAGTYGITENLEVSVGVPLMYSNLNVQADLLAAGVLASDNSLKQVSEHVADSSQPVGVGDLLLRSKYRFLDTNSIDLAAGLVLRVPTGDQANLQGIGFFEVAPVLIASTRLFRPASWALLQGHLNATVGFDTEDVGQSEARWGIGLDWGMSDRVTAALAFLGRNQFGNVAPPGFFDFPRCRGTVAQCASDPAARQGVAPTPLFGLSTARPDYYDVSIGGRASVWRDTIFAYANVVVPLNDGAVRTAPIPLFGIEATF